MRRPHKLVLLAVALTALALTAPSSFGQNVRILSEVNGNPCPTVGPSDSSEFPTDPSITGGCFTHVYNTEGLTRISAHIFGIESTDSRCTTEFTMRVGSNGEGYLTDVNLDGDDCPRRTCDDASGLPETWELHLEETTSTSARAEVHMCVENLDNSGRLTCHLYVPFRKDPTGSDHEYEFGTAAGSGPEGIDDIHCESFSGFQGEMTIHWKTGFGPIEVEHLN